MTIDQSVFLAASLLLLGMAAFLALGVRWLKDARELPYYLLRRTRISQGWRILLLGFTLGLASLLTFTIGPRAVYVVYPPTPSRTPTPTQTPTATITPIPSITPTASITPIPSETATATITPTPGLPDEIRILLRESITPNPEALFSPIFVASRINGFNQAINPQEDFTTPSGRLFGAFSYNNLQDGLRWTAIWYFRGEILCLETQAWDGGTGGYGYTECEPEAWLPGRYEIQIFLGDEWKVSASFEVFE
ncbi:MAG: hypothetical protein E4G99_03390 [Anaerolineales bacterium]|nr:MAG: hypothetical protein E4G99_03390 [Anaerolineales bacterium]